MPVTAAFWRLSCLSFKFGNTPTSLRLVKKKVLPRDINRNTVLEVVTDANWNELNDKDKTQG